MCCGFPFARTALYSFLFTFFFIILKLMGAIKNCCWKEIKISLLKLQGTNMIKVFLDFLLPITFYVTMFHKMSDL